MELRNIKDAPIKKGTRVLIRADLDVTLKNGKILSTFRLEKMLPTIQYVMRQGGFVRLLGYLGRPGGKRILSFSMRPLAAFFERSLKRRVVFIEDPTADTSFRKFSTSSNVVLFENTRFFPGEEKNNGWFAEKLSRWGDIVINDAFANAHRSYASVVGIAAVLPAYAGLQVEKEYSELSRILVNPPRPFVALLGGAKLETKLPLISTFLRIADSVLIGGALANSLFSLQGREVGKSFADILRISSAILRKKKIVLPVDVMTTTQLRKGLRGRISAVDDVRKSEYIADIGPRTVELFAEKLKTAKLVVWNGPMGYSELPQFSQGTEALAYLLRKSKAYTVVGGGDSISFLEQKGLLNGFDHISIGGGAMLEFLSGKKLPGIEILKK